MTLTEAYEQALSDYMTYMATGKWKVARYTIGNREMVYRTPDELAKALKELKALANEEASNGYTGRTHAVSAYRR